MLETGLEPAPSVCAQRGHHGPFANMEKYDAVPGWEGLADCLSCGTTCRADAPAVEPDLPVPEP